MQHRQYLVGRAIAALHKPVHGMNRYVVVPEPDAAFSQHDGLWQPLCFDAFERLMVTPGRLSCCYRQGLLRF
ncbi:hypothetical protein D3C72_2200300 [compost metagenome]